MRVLVLALVLASCSGAYDGPIDIHAIVACDDAWSRNGYTECGTRA